MEQNLSVPAEKKKPGTPEQWATRALFFVGGFGSASWAPLVPVLKARLAIDEGTLGLLLLCIGIGSLLTMPLSGAAAMRFGCRRVLTVAGVLYAVILTGLALVPVLPAAVPVLLAFGAVMGCIDVVVNISAIIVEKAAGRRLMSGMHALWSIGGFAGAGLFGVWVGMLGLSPLASTLIAACLLLMIVAAAHRYLLPYGGGQDGRLVAMPHGIVIFIGIVACIAFLVEGAIMDWSGVFLTTSRSLDLSLAGMGFTVFSAAMLVMRLIGDRTVTLLGQRLVVIGGCGLTFLGFLLLILAPASLPLLLFAGFFLIGVGCANIVPVFFSLVGKQKVMPVGLAMPAVSTFGYLGVLLGPAAIGAVSHVASLDTAFVMLAGLVLAEGLIAAFVYHRLGSDA